MARTRRDEVGCRSHAIRERPRRRYSRRGSLTFTSSGPPTSTPSSRRKEPNFSYRLLRAIYPAFRVLFPDQVIRADDLARAMVGCRRCGTGARGPVFENRDIRAMAESLLSHTALIQRERSRVPAAGAHSFRDLSEPPTGTDHRAAR